jgi:hypothetical protein
MSAVSPLHLTVAKPGLEPYGHLLRMLVPRAVGIAFYDARAWPLWTCDSYDGPDPQPIVDQALTQAPRPLPARSMALRATSRVRRRMPSACATIRVTSLP